MTMTDKLDLLMQEQGLTKASLSREADIPYMTVVNFYEKGTENVKRSTLLKLSRYFGVTVDYLAVDEETRRAYPVYAPAAVTVDMPDREAQPGVGMKKPRVTEFLSGDDPLAPANIVAYDNVPENVRCDFTMQFRGNSMAKLGIGDGDTVFIRAQEHADDHEIVAVVLDHKLTLRRLLLGDGKVVLAAENPAFAPAVFRDMRDVRIVGKAVAYERNASPEE